MKKLLMSFGALAATVSPIATVVSCNSSKDSEAKFAKDASTIVSAFNNTTGGLDVQMEFAELVKEQKRIVALPESTDAEKATKKKVMNKFLVDTGKEYAKVTLTTVNKLASTTLPAEKTEWDGLWAFMESSLTKVTTDAEAKEIGFIDKAEVTKVLSTISKLGSTTVGALADKNDIIIGEYVKDDATKTVEPFYNSVAKDVKTEWGNLYQEWDAIQAISDADQKEEAERRFIVTVGKVLSDMNRYGAGVTNHFVSTTQAGDITPWVEVFEKIHTITNSFTDDSSAMEYGFVDWEEALQAAHQSEDLSKVTKGDPADDATAITIA